MKNFKKIIYTLLISYIFILPVMSFAQSSVGNTGNLGSGASLSPSSSSVSVISSCTLPPNPKLGDLLDFVTCNISRSIIPLIFILASAAFVWGVVQYVILGAEEEAVRAKGKQFMIWGIIALAVMISVWGLVSVLTTTFGINNVIPQLQTH